MLGAGYLLLGGNSKEIIAGVLQETQTPQKDSFHQIQPVFFGQQDVCDHEIKRCLLF